MNIKYTIQVLIALLGFTLMIFFNKGNVIANEWYYLVLVFNTIVLSLFTFKYFGEHPFSINLNNFKLILYIAVATYFILTPLNNCLVVLTSNKEEIIIFDGEVVSAGLFNVSKFKRFMVTYKFLDGKQKTWEVARNSSYYDNGNFVSEQLILDNYWKYKKIQVIGYKSFFGVNLAHFRAIK